jgi:hypothetical protein
VSDPRLALEVLRSLDSKNPARRVVDAVATTMKMSINPARTALRPSDLVVVSVVGFHYARETCLEPSYP